MHLLIQGVKNRWGELQINTCVRELNSLLLHLIYLAVAYPFLRKESVYLSNFGNVTGYNLIKEPLLRVMEGMVLCMMSHRADFAMDYRLFIFL